MQGLSCTIMFRGIGAEAFNHLSDRVCDDAKLGAFASGMHKANRRRFWIYDVNCATVRDVNAERDAALIGDNAIARGEFAAHEGRGVQRVDYSDLFPWICSAVNSGQSPKPVALRISRCAASSRSSTSALSCETSMPGILCAKT